MFRLALLTDFCYVNEPLVRFDRSAVEIRHVGVSADWNKLEFFLQDSQLRLEGLARLGERLPKPIRALIREQLGSIHSGWANCYLANGQYGKARQAVTKAIRLDPTFNIAIKWLLTWITPGLAVRTVRQRQQSKEGSLV